MSLDKSLPAMPPIDLTNPQTLIAGAGMATSFIGKAGNPAQFALDYISNEFAMEDEAKAGAKALGSTKAAALQDSPFYKEFMREMYEKQPYETAIKSVVSIAGGVLGAVLLTGMKIPLGGIIGAIGGGIGANMLASKYVDSKRADFAGFANGLESLSQQGALRGEQVFVALMLNHPEKELAKKILKQNGFKNKSDFIEAMEKEPDRITNMMRAHDEDIRSSIGIQLSEIKNTKTGFNLTASEMLAGYYNSDAAIDMATGLKGANLLSTTHVGQAAMQINGVIAQVQAQQMQAQHPQPEVQKPKGLPDISAKKNLLA